MTKLSKLSVSNPKLWVVIGVGVAGIVILAEVHRRRRRLSAGNAIKEDFGAFIERFELLPFPQPPPPAAPLLLAGLTFAIKDNIDVKGYVTGLGSPEWKRTHEAAAETAAVVDALLKSGATCIGKTIMDELGLGVTGRNVHYGTPTNPKLPFHVPGGSSSGSAVAVASNLVDFALATDTTGCIRVPASFCGVLGFRPSHGIVSTTGVLPVSQSLDTIGWFARDPSVLCKIGRILLQLAPTVPKRMRRFIIADDLFQLSKVPKQKIAHVVRKVTEKISGCQAPKDMNLGKYIASNVPSLKVFCEESINHHHGMSTLRALSSVMFLLLSYEFRTNYEEWINEVKLRLDPDVSGCIAAAATLTPENIKLLYKVRTETRTAFKSLLKDDGILVIPTITDPPSKLPSKKGLSMEARDRAFAVLSIASISGCCQVLEFYKSQIRFLLLSQISMHVIVMDIRLSV
nr:outer envelope protein 64, mitochondrial-like [Ipomoea trifida]